MNVTPISRAEAARRKAEQAAALRGAVALKLLAKKPPAPSPWHHTSSMPAGTTTQALVRLAVQDSTPQYAAALAGDATRLVVRYLGTPFVFDPVTGKGPLGLSLLPPASVVDAVWTYVWDHLNTTVADVISGLEMDISPYQTSAALQHLLDTGRVVRTRVRGIWVHTCR